MWDAVLIISFWTAPVFLIMALVSAIRKTGRWKRYLAYSGICFAIFLVASVQVGPKKPAATTEVVQKQPTEQGKQTAQHSQEQKVPEQSEKPASNQEDKPKAESKPKAENKPAANEKFIPGLTTADIKLNLENHGFEFTSKPMTNSEGYLENGEATDLATGVEYSVTIDALMPMKVRAVTFRAEGALAAGTISRSQFMNITKEFLGYCATVPYEGANPQQARKWVESNIGKVKQGKPVETVIGSAKLVLAGDGYLYSLQLFPKDED
ncbi:MAG: hypothetical protein C0P72_011910 [Clostridia bacterium]